jgi:hypothetical protein
MVFATFFDLPTILVGVAQQFFWVKILESCEKWHWLPIFISSTSQNMWSILVVENGVCDFGRFLIDQQYWLVWHNSSSGLNFVKSCEKVDWLPIFICGTLYNMWNMLVVENGVCDVWVFFDLPTILVVVAQQFFWVKFCEKLCEGFDPPTILVGVAQQFFWVKFCEKL